MKKIQLILMFFCFVVAAQSQSADQTPSSASSTSSSQTTAGATTSQDQSSESSSTPSGENAGTGEGSPTDGGSSLEQESSTQDKATQTSVSIINSAISGKSDLSSFSNDQLTNALSFSHLHGDVGYDVIMLELMERAQKENESEIAKLIKEKGKLQAEIDKIREKVDTDLKSYVFKSTSEIVQILVDRGEEVTQEKIDQFAQEEKESVRNEMLKNDGYYEKLVSRNEKIDKLQTSIQTASEKYEQMSITTKNIQNAGDPVNVVSGRYICTNSEITVPTSDFSISRNWSNSGSRYNFGQNWFSSLDSKIIRCRRPDLSEDVSLYEELVSLIDKDLEIIKKLKEIDSSGASLSSNEDDLSESELLQLKEDTLQNIQFIKETKARNSAVDNLNKADVFGEFSYSEILNIDYDCIFFIDAQGKMNLIKYEENGIWKNINKSNENQYTVFSLDKNLDIATDMDASGGFLVQFQNGNKKYFNEYGFLIKEVSSTNQETKYDYENGRLSKIHLPFNQVVNIYRNEKGYISKISNSLYGENVYQYKDNILTSVIYNNKNLFCYEYDGDKDLIKITNKDANSAASTSIQINYEFYSASSTKKVSSVVNGENQIETFEYNEGSNRTIHTTFGGKEEVFEYDINGNITYKKDDSGNELKLTVEKDGTVKSMNYNGEISNYKYNQNGQLVEILYKDGSSESFEYDGCGNKTQIQNRDGDIISFYYDTQSKLQRTDLNYNVDTRIEYNQNGGIKNLYYDELTEHYEYNDLGFVTEKTVSPKNGSSTKELFEYNQQGRISKHTDIYGQTTFYEYTANSTKSVIPNVYENTKCYDFLGNLIKTEEKDLQEKTVYTTEYSYDKNSRIKQIKLDGEVYKTFSYNSSGQLICEIEWELFYLKKDNPRLNSFKQGLKQEYKYDEKGRCVQLKKSAVFNEDFSTILNTSSVKTPLDKNEIYIEDYLYEKRGLNETKTTKAGGVFIKSETLDEYGRTIKTVGSDGFTEEFKYTPSGRLLQTTNSQEDEYSYGYNKDGSYSIVHKNCNSEVETFYYNKNDLLQMKVNSKNEKTEYSYDSFANVRSIKSPVSTTKYEYDNYNRKIGEEIFSLDGDLLYCEKIEYNQNEIKTTKGDLYESVIQTDVFGRIICTKDKNGINYYSYDILDRLVSETDSLGNKIVYTYSPQNNISNVKFQDGTDESYVYNLNNQVVEILQNQNVVHKMNYSPNKKIIYKENQNGDFSSVLYGEENQITKVESSSQGNIEYKNDSVNKKLSMYKNGTLYKSASYDSKGRVLSEKNTLNKEKVYRYKNDELVYAKSFSCSELSISYDNNSIKKKYSTGLNELIVKNGAGNIVQQKNDSLLVNYKYDKGGNLIQLTDEKSTVEVTYSYDKYGRLNQIKGNGISFEYDERGLLSRTEDLHTDYSLSFEYDERRREIIRIDSNGNRIETSYTDDGLVESVATYDKFSILLDAEIYLYDENGRCTHIVDENLGIQKFTYNTKNQVVSVESPYTQEIAAESKEKAASCGFIIKDDFPVGRDVKLSQAELSKLRRISADIGLYKSVPSTQYCWFDDFEYKDTLLFSKTDPFGKTLFFYDSEGRMTNINCSNTESFGIELKWNDDNLLVEEACSQYRITYEYDEHEEVKYKRIEDFETQTTNEYFYTYDVFCRLDTFQKDGGQQYKNVYNGFSSEIVETVAIGKNGVAYDVYSEDNTAVLQNRKYKWIDTGGYDEDSQSKYRFGNYKDSDSVANSANNSSSTTIQKSYGFTKFQKYDYFSKIIKYAGYENDYDYDGIKEVKNALEIQDIYDCADVSTCIQSSVLKELNITPTSKTVSDFSKKVAEENYQDAKGTVCSTDYIGNPDNATVLVKGIERNAETNSYDEKQLDSTVKNLKQKVDIGSVICWQNNDSKKSWTGHVMTVVAREYDKNGEVIGVVCIQGHTGGNKTEVIYMPLTTWEIPSWLGNFAGLVTLEAEQTKKCSISE